MSPEKSINVTCMIFYKRPKSRPSIRFMYKTQERSKFKSLLLEESTLCFLIQSLIYSRQESVQFTKHNWKLLLIVWFVYTLA